MSPQKVARFETRNSLRTFALIALTVLLSYLSPAHAADENSFNIRDYGAIGDGSADDTAAIQAALNAASASGGGKVFVPSGTYMVNATLRIPGSFISFVGTGPASILKSGGGFAQSTYLLELAGPYHDIDINYIFFMGQGSGQSDPAGVHITPGSYRVQVHNCRFYNFGYYGGVDYSSSYLASLRDNFAFNCWKGISVSGTVPDSSVVVSSNVLVDCTVGIALEFGHDIIVSNNSIEYTNTPGSFGIQVIGTTNVVITNNTLYAPRNTSGNAITLGPESVKYGSPQRAKITGNSITGFAYGIRVETMTDGIIAGNTIKGQSAYGIMLDLSNSSTRNPSTRNLITGNLVDVATSAKGIAETANGGDYNVLEHNRVLNTSNPVLLTGANSKVRENTGFTTEANGTATVSAGTTSVTVTHGLSRTPNLKDVSVTPTNAMGNANKFWVDNITTTSFRINVNVNPGPSSATFAWTVVER